MDFEWVDIGKVRRTYLAGIRSVLLGRMFARCDPGRGSAAWDLRGPERGADWDQIDVPRPGSTWVGMSRIEPV